MEGALTLKIRKPVYAFIILIILSALFSLGLYHTKKISIRGRVNARNEQKFEGIAKILDALAGDIDEEISGFSVRNDKLLELIPFLLRGYIADHTYTGPEIINGFYGVNNFVIRIEDDQVIYPQEALHFPRLTAELIRSDLSRYEWRSARNDGTDDLYLISTRHIGDDYFFINLNPIKTFYQTIRRAIELDELIADIEKSFDCQVLLIDKLEQDSENTFFLYNDGEFWKNRKPEMLGIDQKFIKEQPELTEIAGKAYQCFYKPVRFFDRDLLAVILSDPEDTSDVILSSVLMTVLPTIFSAFLLVFWLYWVQSYVRDKEITAGQAAAYQPAQIKRLSLVFCILGAIGIFLVAISYQSIYNLRREGMINRNGLKTIMKQLPEEIKNAENLSSSDDRWLSYLAGEIAPLISGAENLQSRESLAAVNEMLGSQYIMLFDEDGKEIVSSNDLLGYSFENTPGFADFNRILSGLKVLASDKSIDPVLDLPVRYFAGRTQTADGKGFGAMVIAMTLAEGNDANESGFVEFLEYATTEGNIVAVVNKKDNKINFASSPELRERIIPELIYSETKPGESDMDSYLIDGIRYYGPYGSDKDFVYYYLTMDDYVRIRSFMFAILSTAGFLAILLILRRYMIGSYTRDAFKTMVRIKTVRNNNSFKAKGFLSELFRKTENASLSQKLNDFWSHLTPEHKVKITFQGIMLCCLFTIGVLQFSGKFSAERSAIGFILSGNWKRGPNIFGLGGTIMILISFIVFSFIKEICEQCLSLVNDPRIETVGRLIFSLIQYAAVVFSVYQILGFLGFTTTIQLTSIGIVSFAITLGSQDLVADILAGIFIIFEGDFHVGDLIEVNGFRGIVREIGARSTKLLGLEDNIKIINNKNIKDVLNLSELNTWYTMDFQIDNSQDLDEVENVLKSELPGIGASIPEILSGPYYKGIWDINYSNYGTKYKLSIISECEAKNIRIVQRELNKRMILLFKKHGY